LRTREREREREREGSLFFGGGVGKRLTNELEKIEFESQRRTPSISG
jgi:hypothetical protein